MYRRKLKPGVDARHLGALILTLAGPAAAAPTAVRIDYRAPAECPDRAEFLNEVLQRLSDVHVVDESERRFEVVVESSSDRSRARLEFVDADSRRVRRELSARDCEEAASGMALVTALAIDPRLSIPAPRREADREPAAEEREPAERDPKPSRPVIEPGPATGVRDRPARPSAGHGGWDFRVGAGLGAVSDVGPTWAPSGLVYTEIGRHTLRARLSFGYADSAELDLNGRAARFRLTHGRGELCPLAVVAGPVAARPCTALELGAFQAAGVESARVAVAKSSSELWLAGLAALRAELALGDALSLELQAQLRAPFLLRSYVFEKPETLAYETPHVGGGVVLGAGARLQ